MKKLNDYMREKTPEQVFSLCLLVFIILLMIVCVIFRLFGIGWFSAKYDNVKIPNIVWQEVIKSFLFFIELVFIYKILMRSYWIDSIFFSLAQVVIVAVLVFVVKIQLLTNLFNLICYFAIPMAFRRKWFCLIDSAFMYGINILYCFIFLYGRIGVLGSYQYNFVASILGMIDYKLFIVTLYLIQKNFGGFRLWKKQKTLICQIDQMTK